MRVRIEGAGVVHASLGEDEAQAPGRPGRLRRRPAQHLIGSRTLSAWRVTPRSSPVFLDVAGFTAITVGVWLLGGEWAWLAAGGLLSRQDWDGLHLVVGRLSLGHTLVDAALLTVLGLS